MKIQKQKNVYYLDLVANVYKGYIITHIHTNNATTIRYKYGALNIQNIQVFTNTNNPLVSKIEYDLLKSESEQKDIFWNYVSIMLDGKYQDIKIKIEYENLESNTSILFYKPINGDKHKEVIAYNNQRISTNIFPSVDLNQTYPWELVYITSATEDLKIISPGVLKSFVEETTFSISIYSVSKSSPDIISFAIGTYSRHEIFNGDDKKVLYCPIQLSNNKESISEIIDDFSNILKYCEFFLQMPYPPESLNILFTIIDIEKMYALNLAILNISRLSLSNDIEPKFIMKRLVSEIIASQLFYFHCSYIDITDFWIFCGLKGYFEDYCARILLGNNEFLYQYKKDKDYVIRNDVYEYPLCCENRSLESYKSDFFMKKSKLVFHTLENNLSKAFLEKISNILISKRDEIDNNFTSKFLNIIKDITGKDMKKFFEFYVFRPGLLKLVFKFNIDTKKNKVSFKIEHNPTSMLVNHNTTILGNINITSYEVEGCFDHSFDITQNNYFYYHIRTKKKKKMDEEEDEVMPLLWMRADIKREHLLDTIIEQPDYMFIEQALDKDVIGQMEALEQLSKNPSLQVCEIMERIMENSHVFYKIRIMVMYIISKIRIDGFIGFQRLIQYFTKKYCVPSSTILKPNDFMLISYFMQKHCIKAISETNISETIIINDRQVRIASIVASFIINILKYNDNSANSYNDSWYIASVIENLCKPVLVLLSEDSKNDHQEDFSESDYSNDYNNIYDSDSEGHNDLENILKDENKLKRPKISKPVIEESINNYAVEALHEVERYRIKDLLFPSHKNIITESAIYFIGNLALHGAVTIKKETLLNLSRFPNFYKIRKAAITMLLIIFKEDIAVLNYLFAIIENESEYYKNVVLDSVIALLEVGDTLKKILQLNKERIMQIHNKLIFNKDCREKLMYIVEFLHDEDIDIEEYNKKIIRNYEEKINYRFYMQKIGSEINNLTDTTCRIKFKDFLQLKKNKLENTMKIRLKLPKDKLLLKISEKEHVASIEVKIKLDQAPSPCEVVEDKIATKDIKEAIKEDIIEPVVIIEGQSTQVEEIRDTRLEDMNIQEMLIIDNLTDECLSTQINNSGDTSKAEKLTDIEVPLASNSESDSYKIFPDFDTMTCEEFLYTISGSRDLYTISTFENDNIYPEPCEMDPGNYQSIPNNYEYNMNITNDLFFGSSIYKRPESHISEKQKLIDLEKFLMEDSEHCEDNNTVKTQVLDERDFEADFNNIGNFHTNDYNNINDYNNFDFNAFRNKNEPFDYINSAEYNKNSLLTIDQYPEVNHNYMDSEKLSETFNRNSYNVTKSILEDFLENSDESLGNDHIVQRINEHTLRFKLKTTLRLRAVSIEKVSQPRYKSVNRHDDEYSLKKTMYSLKSTDSVSKKLFYGTINNMSIKQVNKVIFKNKENMFFDWKPKTFKEIEVLAQNPSKYKKLIREMERSLVFALSYSIYGGRTYNIAKKLFDSFENKIYEFHQIPEYVTPISAILRNYCVDFLNKLFLNEKFISFIKPVNIERLESYVDIVRFPICLEQVQQKMISYTTLEAFFGDLKQIYKNCCYFNQNDSEIVFSAKKLLKKVQEFDKHLINQKPTVRSEEIIKILLTRFMDNKNHPIIVNMLERGTITTFCELIGAVRNLKNQDSNKFISVQELNNEIIEFENQIFFAFNVYNGKVFSFGL